MLSAGISAFTLLPSNAMAENGHAAHQVMKQANIMFSKDKVYELAYVSIIPGMEQQVFGDYFPKALPLAAKYGGKSVGMLAVPGAKDGSKQAQMVAIFEWPSVDAWLQLHKDPAFLKIVPIRDQAIAFGNPGNFYTVSEDVAASFTEGKMYELANYTLKQDDDGWSSKKSVFDKYIKNEQQVAADHGSMQDVLFTPVPMSAQLQHKVKIACSGHNGYASDDMGLVPQLTRLREWSSFDSYNQHLNSGSINKVNKLKRDAVKHEYTLQTVFGFPAG
jgi:uncharacterized protein (DUF1330 family)